MSEHMNPDEDWEIEFADGSVSPLLPSPQLVDAIEDHTGACDDHADHHTPSRDLDA